MTNSTKYLAVSHAIERQGYPPHFFDEVMTMLEEHKIQLGQPYSYKYVHFALYETYDKAYTALDKAFGFIRDDNAWGVYEYVKTDQGSVIYGDEGHVLAKSK